MLILCINHDSAFTMVTMRLTTISKSFTVLFSLLDNKYKKYTYLASRAKAIMPAAIGVAALVPPKFDVHFPSRSVED